MATTAAGTPYVESSDLVANYPAVSLALAEHIDDLPQKILQVVSGSYATPVTVASLTYTDTGLAATITPQYSSSQVLVLCFQHYEISRTFNIGLGLQLLRGASVIFAPDAYPYGSGYIYGSSGVTNAVGGRAPIMYLDTPATTTATTYKVQGRPDQTSSGGNAIFQGSNCVSSILLIEVSA